MCRRELKLFPLCSGFNTFYIKRIYCLKVKQPKDGALKEKNQTRKEISPQCSLVRQEVKRKQEEIWERLDAKLLGFWTQVPASEVTTFGGHAAKPGWFPLKILNINAQTRDVPA